MFKLKKNLFLSAGSLHLHRAPSRSTSTSGGALHLRRRSVRDPARSKETASGSQWRFSSVQADPAAGASSVNGTATVADASFGNGTASGGSQIRLPWLGSDEERPDLASGGGGASLGSTGLVDGIAGQVGILTVSVNRH